MSSLLEVISEAGRHRNVTHILISSYLFDRYRHMLRAKDKARGFTYTKVHSTMILVVDWLPREPKHPIIAFNAKRKYMQPLMEALRSESHKAGKEELYEVLDKNHKELVLMHWEDPDEAAE